MMRVRFVVPGALDQPTGGYIYDRLIVERLRQLGNEVDVGVSSDPDVIVGDGLAIPELAESFPRESVPRVLLVHHLGSWESERDASDAARLHVLETRAIAASDLLITTSGWTAARLAEEFPRGPKSRVVSPGADRLPLVQRLPRSSGPLRLLSVGSLIPRKRIALVLDALPENAELDIVGDASRDPECARAITERVQGVSRVALHGIVDDARLAELMAGADALVLASTLEGYGMVITEALRAGLPVIVARSAVEAVDCEDEAMVSFEDSAELAEILSQPQRVRGLCPRAITRSWQLAGDEFRAALTLAIDLPKRAPPFASAT